MSIVCVCVCVCVCVRESVNVNVHARELNGFGVSKDDLGGNKNKVRVPLNL